MLSRANRKIVRKNLRKLNCQTKLLIYFFLNQRRRPDELFAGAWRIVDSVPGRRSAGDLIGVPTRHIRHYRLRKIVKLIFPRFSPAITVDEKIIQVIKRSPSVIVTVHSSAEFAICAALDRAGISSAIVTTTPARKSDFENYEFATLPQNILRARDVFVKARDALKRGRVVICDVDYRINRHDPNTRVCVAPAFFEFRRAVNARLFYCFTSLGEDGQMHCTLEAGREGLPSPNEDALDFIAFIDRCKGEPSGLTIRDWSGPK